MHQIPDLLFRTIGAYAALPNRRNRIAVCPFIADCVLVQATPIRLSVDQLSQLIYGELKQRERVMVLLDFGTGLRRGELSGIRWEDICFEDKVLMPKRSIVKQRIGKVKTEASKKSIPLDDG